VPVLPTRSRTKLRYHTAKRNVGRIGDDSDVAKPLDWNALLVDGYEPLKVAQRVFRRLPHGPRCKLCQNPFAGIGGSVLGLMGRKPSRKNPNLCQACFDRLPAGGIEIDIGVVFADVRGSTEIGERATATEFAGRMSQFYATATDVLIRHDGVIDKLIGDEVMALFFSGVAGREYRRKAALAALDLAGAVGDLPVGVAAYAGVAFVGNVGSGTVMDFTALGDAVNVAARLQSHASPGQVVLASELYGLIRADYPAVRSAHIEVRGREEPVDVEIITV
jgi:adenylate cyclase